MEKIAQKRGTEIWNFHCRKCQYWFMIFVVIIVAPSVEWYFRGIFSRKVQISAQAYTRKHSFNFINQLTKIEWVEGSRDISKFCFMISLPLSFLLQLRLCSLLLLLIIHQIVSTIEWVTAPHKYTKAIRHFYEHKHKHHDWNAHNSLFELIGAAWYGL